jgi:RNase adaptor protein for sRNA GlmZ degradation
MKRNLTIHIYSFSYHGSGIPPDPAGHGGGFVFDCRALPNPGREERYREMTGMDPEVVRYLEERGEVAVFRERVFGLVLDTAEAEDARGFADMTVAFGCTGGRHRSVYFAEELAGDLRRRGFSCTVEHRDLPGVSV